MFSDKAQHRYNKTRSSIDWYLHAGHHYGTMSDREARAIAGVNRTTFDRWKRGESSAPQATLELLRLHAFGEPPAGFGSTAWRGFMFKRGLLVTDWGDELTPQELHNFRLYKAHFYRDTERAIISEREPDIYFGQPFFNAAR